VAVTFVAKPAVTNAMDEILRRMEADRIEFFLMHAAYGYRELPKNGDAVVDPHTGRRWQWADETWAEVEP
jgi:hypothetical protein